MFLIRRTVPMSDIHRGLLRWANEQDGAGLDWYNHSQNTFPLMNVYDDGEALHIEADVPGFEMADLDVSVFGDELTLKGRREISADEKDQYHCRERFAGEFSRTVRLPIEVDAERVSATLKNGVLSIALPKAQAALPRRIEVKGS